MRVYVNERHLSLDGNPGFIFFRNLNYKNALYITKEVPSFFK